MRNIKTARINPATPHFFRKHRDGLCADCTGNYDMHGHVVARRVAMGNPYPCEEHHSVCGKYAALHDTIPEERDFDLEAFVAAHPGLG